MWSFLDQSLHIQGKLLGRLDFPILSLKVGYPKFGVKLKNPRVRIGELGLISQPKEILFAHLLNFGSTAFSSGCFCLCTLFTLVKSCVINHGQLSTREKGSKITNYSSQLRSVHPY